MLKKASISIFALSIVCLSLVLIFYSQSPQILEKYAVHPKEYSFFYAAFTGVWLHANLDHLLGNLISLISLSAIFLLLFPKKWMHFFTLQYLTSSVIFFFVAPIHSQHIGASVWVYAFATFILTILLLQPNKKLMAIFFITVLFYGGMWWGLLPLLPHVSYEGHISGSLTGILLAFILRRSYVKILPKSKIPDWFHHEMDEKNPYDSID